MIAYLLRAALVRLDLMRDGDVRQHMISCAVLPDSSDLALCTVTIVSCGVCARAQLFRDPCSENNMA